MKRNVATCASVICADLVGSNTATACGIVVKARAPVLELCRQLVKAGHPPDLPLEAYRGPTLCLRVESIGVGARLTVDESENCRLARFRPRAEATLASRANQNCEPLTEAHQPTKARQAQVAPKELACDVFAKRGL
jgi:hypothetical protein